MNTTLKRRGQRLFLWPVAGVVIGALAAGNPFYAPRLTVAVGVVAWCVDMVLCLTLAANPTGARVGVLMAGAFMAVPCFVQGPALMRALLMCFAALPFFFALAGVLLPEITGFRARLYFFCTWGFTREVKRRPSRFNLMSLVQLVAATAVFSVCLIAVESISAFDVGIPVRWFVFGIAILAFAEMATACHNLVTGLLGLTAPALLQSPFLSMSLNEFWTKRWNPATSVLFRSFSYQPLARYGASAAMCVTFFMSGVAHMLLVFMAIGDWNYAFANGAFFCIQPAFIAMERHMKIRLWRPAARRAWTISVLAITSPLFVAPALQVVGRGWDNSSNGQPANAMLPTVVTLSFVICVVTGFSLASLVSCPEERPAKAVLATAASE